MKTEVKLEKLRFETYPLGNNDPYPPLLRQGYRMIYPYAWQRAFSERRETQDLAVWRLRNAFLDLQVAPELGGRLIRARERRGGTDLFYYNPVVRPAAIGLRGAWYAGGVEFNFPNSHHVETCERVLALGKSREDGGAEIVISDLDRVSGCRWTLRIGLNPTSAEIEINPFLENPTDYPQPIWYWTNAAVGPHREGRFTFPGDWVVAHYLGRVLGTAELASFPCNGEKDLAASSSYDEPTSLFVVDPAVGFFAYSPDPRRGTLIRFAPLWDAPGRKLWHWGYGDDGRVAVQALGGNGEPYAEIQSGRPFSQLGYEWLPPHTALCWTETWGWAHRLPCVHVANRELALGAAREAEGAALYVAAPRALRGLCVWVDGEETPVASLGPGLAQRVPVRVPTGSARIRITSEGRLLWEGRWAEDAKGPTLTSGAQGSRERERYLAELHVPDFTRSAPAGVGEGITAAWQAARNRQIALARSRWRHVLEVDPRCVEAWRELGFDALRRGLWSVAEECFRTALSHDSADIESLRGLGLTWERFG